MFEINSLITIQISFQDLPVTEGIIEEPWGNLFLVLEMVGRKLNWELSDMFSMPM